MTPNERFVIVGAGLAGAKAAETLREEGFGGQVVLLGDETDRPYERPPLSKGFLQGTLEREKVFVHPADWYGVHDVDLRLGTAATSLDRGTREVVLAGADRLGFDKLLLATGSTPRRLPIPGTDLDGVHYLRRLEDSQRLRSAFADGSSVVVIGGGWIGLETAAAARAAGLGTTILEAGELPLLRVLGREVAQVFADLHRRNGVDLRTGVSVQELVGSDGRVTGVRLGDSTVIPADIVIVGVGITPNDGLAREAGLSVENGIDVNGHLQTSDPHIYAAGDVANAYHPVLGRNLRVEHWANALHQGPVAARSMLNEGVVYDRLPYFFTDQYDLGMEYTGYVEPDGYDQVAFRGDPASGEFIAFWLDKGKVRAGMNVNTWDVTDAIKKLILSDREVSVAALTDSASPLPD